MGNQLDIFFFSFLLKYSGLLFSHFGIKHQITLRILCGKKKEEAENPE